MSISSNPSSVASGRFIRTVEISMDLTARRPCIEAERAHEASSSWYEGSVSMVNFLSLWDDQSDNRGSGLERIECAGTMWRSHYVPSSWRRGFCFSSRRLLPTRQVCTMDRCSTCGRSSGEMEILIARGASDHTGIGVSNVARVPPRSSWVSVLRNKLSIAKVWHIHRTPLFTLIEPVASRPAVALHQSPQ